MINVDKRNGDIYIDEVRFNRSSSIMDLNKLKEKYTLKSYGVPDGRMYYVIKDYDAGETTISFAFYNGKFTFLEIYEGSNYDFPRFAMTEAQKNIVKKKLLLLGGEQNIFGDRLVILKIQKLGLFQSSSVLKKVNLITIDCRIIIAIAFNPPIERLIIHY